MVSASTSYDSISDAPEITSKEAQAISKEKIKVVTYVTEVSLSEKKNSAGENF